MTDPEVAQTNESNTVMWSVAAAAAFGAAWPVPTAWVAAIGFMMLVIAPGFEVGSDAGIWPGIIVGIPLSATYLAAVWLVGRWLLRLAGSPRPGLVSSAAMVAPTLAAAAVTPFVNMGIWDYVRVISVAGAFAAAVTAILSQGSRGGQRRT